MSTTKKITPRYEVVFKAGHRVLDSQSHTFVGHPFMWLEDACEEARMLNQQTLQPASTRESTK